MRYLSVCSGMEAASVAWHTLGWTPVGFSEIEPFPCAILKHRFPNTPNYGSLTDYQQWPLAEGSVDLLVGGTPCQSFSVAGLRKGLADPRGNLALVFLGLADKLKPRWIVWENVPGVLSSAGGRDFGAFLGALVELGYGFAYRVLDAQHFGVPQRRRRVFVVACLGDWVAPAKVLLEPDCLRRDTKKGRAKGQGTAPGVEGGVDADHPAGCWWDGGQVSQTLDAVLQKGQTMPEKNRFPAVLQPLFETINIYGGNKRSNRPDGGMYVRSEDVSKCLDAANGLNPTCSQGGTAIIQPKSHWEGGDVHPTLNRGGTGQIGYSNQELFSQKGGCLVPGVPFRKSKRASSETDDERWVLADESNTLNNFDLGDTRTTHAIVGPIAIQGTIIGRSENAGPQGVGASEGPMFTLTKTDIHGVSYCADVAPTVTSSGPPYSRTGNERVEAEAIVAFQPGNLRREAVSDPSTETFPTLKSSAGDQSPHVAHPVVPLDGMNLLSRLGDCGENHSMQNFEPGDPSFTLRKGGVQHGILTPMAVRRLTPVECERLQGFPDNWSRIPWKGKPEEQCPDGPRYKACGNSMAVPVMRWIGERIQLLSTPTTTTTQQ